MRDRRSPLRRSLAFFIVAALFVGGGLAVAGFATRGGGDDVVLVVDGAVGAGPSSTLAPLLAAPSSTPPPIEPSVTGRRATDERGNQRPRSADRDDIERSDVASLAAQLPPPFSAIPEEVAPRPRPVKLQIEAIDVARFPVRAVGLEPDGQLEVPDETEIGWYQYGATAGQPGATVLAAHVSWNRTSGPFARLGSVDPGAQVEVTLDDGTVRRYQVIERAVYGKLELPRDRIWRNTGDETLVLITCGGDYNPDIRRYRENIVVYAVPVA